MKNIYTATITCFILVSCSDDKILHSYYGMALGTTYHIKYMALSNEKYNHLFDSIFNGANHSLSNYHKDSELYKINSGDTTVVVGKWLKKVFLMSKEVYSKSKGYFDPTVGIMVNAWGFGSGNQIPLDSAKIKELMKYVSFNKVLLFKDKIIKKHPQTFIDFNAIAKGYTVDVIGEVLSKKGVENYLIEIGGEILTSGKNSRGKDWVISIEKPIENLAVRKSSLYVKLSGGAIATSGNYRKFRIDNRTGEKYVHTVNPFTGFTEKNDMISASVIAKNCALADAYATTFMTMGYEKSIAFIEENKDLKLKVFFIYFDKKRQIKTFLSEGINTLP